MRFSILVLSLLFVVPSFAGDTKGQGGDILVCQRDAIKTYSSFDLYERYNYRLSLAFSETASSGQIVDQILLRLQELDPERACLYQKYLNDFSAEAEFVETKIGPIDDEGLPIVPSHCKLEQAAIQTLKPDARGIKYKFYQPLVAELNDLHRTALYFHEFVYRDGLAHNVEVFKDSQEVRYFVAFLFSKQFQAVTPKRYSEILKFVRLPSLKQECSLQRSH